MMSAWFHKGRLLLTAAALLGAAPAAAQGVSVAEGVHAGELAVPVNKSQVLRSDQPYARAMIGNPEIADVLPLTASSLYVLGKKAGTTSLTLYDRSNRLIAVVDVTVGPDVTTLKRQMSELMPGERIGARISNEAVVLEGVASSSMAVDRAVQLAKTYAGDKVVNLISVGSSQQVMLEVRFSEVKRQALRQLGIGLGISGNRTIGVIGSGSSLTPDDNGGPVYGRESIIGSFGIITRALGVLGADVNATLDALERRGTITTLAEPTLIALSGETASFLAGGEFPVPVAQDGSGNGSTITVEWKPFGVSLAFTPTVLADGVINLVVTPEVSSIDATASITINNLTIPGLQTRRAKTVVELRDGESFALAGLLRKDFQSTVRQFPLLGSLPIIGTLFRSTGFNRDETELVIIVTPRLVRPVRAGTLRAPTDTVQPPNDADLIFQGRTDTGVPAGDRPFHLPVPPKSLQPTSPAGAGTAAGSGRPSAARQPVTLEKEYGHVL
jgi:pilus assembly protein CpaC